MNIHKGLALTVALGLPAATAQADGFYISSNISATTSGHTLERNGSTPGLPVPDTAGVGFSETTDFSGGLALGYERNIGNGPFFLGAEAFYNFEDASSRNIVGVLATDVSLNASYGARILAGVEVAPKLSLYGHVGYTTLDFDLRNSYTFAPPVRTDSRREGAVSFGAGARYAVNDQFSVFTEFTQVADVSFDGIPEVAGGTGRVNPNRISLNKVSFGVKYDF